jgi:serine/threonine protein kinase
MHLSLQYGVSVDVYSLSIVIFELFSSLDPFPGNLGQIFEAKRLDRKPVMPSDFPPQLKDFILCGWSKEPKNRPPLAECMSALNNMLTREDYIQATDRDNSLMWSRKNPSNEKEEKDVSQEMDDIEALQREGNLNENKNISEEELCINSETGNLLFCYILLLHSGRRLMGSRIMG